MDKWVGWIGKYTSSGKHLQYNNVPIKVSKTHVFHLYEMFLKVGGYPISSTLSLVLPSQFVLSPAHPGIFYVNEQVQRFLRRAPGRLGDEPDGAAQGAAGVQPEGFHQVMLPRPDWLRRIRETRMDPYFRRGWKIPLQLLSLYFILIYQGEWPLFEWQWKSFRKRCFTFHLCFVEDQLLLRIVFFSFSTYIKFCVLFLIFSVYLFWFQLIFPGVWRQWTFLTGMNLISELSLLLCVLLFLSIFSNVLFCNFIRIYIVLVWCYLYNIPFYIPTLLCKGFIY